MATDVSGAADEEKKPRHGTDGGVAAKFIGDPSDARVIEERGEDALDDVARAHDPLGRRAEVAAHHARFAHESLLVEGPIRAHSLQRRSGSTPGVRVRVGMGMGIRVGVGVGVRRSGRGVGAEARAVAAAPVRAAITGACNKGSKAPNNSFRVGCVCM